MSILETKIDFMVTVEVKGANPNGDPLNGNLPRADYNGYGVISDVCIKRKIRNRLQEMGSDIFVKSNDRCDDGFKSLEARFNSEFKKDDKDEVVYASACKKWIDVRGFGQVMTFQKRSIGIRGPISISIAKSVSPILIDSMQITRSTNGMEKKKKADDGSESDGRSSDTMGSKHFIDYGVYIIKGSVNAYFAEKTGFSKEDLELVKDAIRTLFVNDMSSARPEGSMRVKELFWFEHSSKLGNVSTGKIHDLIEWDEEASGEMNCNSSYENLKIRLNPERLENYKNLGLKVEVVDGI